MKRKIFQGQTVKISPLAVISKPPEFSIPQKFFAHAFEQIKQKNQKRAFIWVYKQLFLFTTLKNTKLISNLVFIQKHIRHPFLHRKFPARFRTNQISFFQLNFHQSVMKFFQKNNIQQNV
eukprot:TRINITY_DN11125_c0_g4_i2.p4 TRINITY_DN11125_c0_g4~~TRINITY_DN11125_c0_g4_i2.p4  ORF type:complete len:120 (+),score=8.69 TRINITY_DN11125_c0_g4_i2:452-811(+)